MKENFQKEGEKWIAMKITLRVRTNSKEWLQRLLIKIGPNLTVPDCECTACSRKMTENKEIRWKLVQGTPAVIQTSRQLNREITRKERVLQIHSHSNTGLSPLEQHQKWLWEPGGRGLVRRTKWRSVLCMTNNFAWQMLLKYPVFNK